MKEVKGFVPEPSQLAAPSAAIGTDLASLDRLRNRLRAYRDRAFEGDWLTDLASVDEAAMVLDELLEVRCEPSRRAL